MWKKLGFAALTLPFFYHHKYFQNPQCCGIIGVLTVNQNAEKIIMEGVELLQNRGYDSAGIATVNTDHNKILISKFASDTAKNIDCFTKIHQEIDKHQLSQIGIGHTRWATCGSKIDKNAHPHTDHYKRVALVHNGTLENYMELKNELINDHHVIFESETDTEVIAQLIGANLHEGKDFMKSVELSISRLIGQWGLVVIDRDQPDQMIACRQGSPILVGYNQDSIFVASEKIAFEKYTANYIALQDGEIMLLKLSERNTFFKQIKHRIQIHELSQDPIQLKPKSPYKSFFQMEIFDQPESLLRTLGNGARLAGQPDCSKLGGFERKEDELVNIENLVMLACGTSLNAAYSVMHIFKLLKIFESVTAIEASEFNMNDLPKNKPGVITISQSGETKDIIRILQDIKNHGAMTIGVVNVVGSVIANMVDCGVYMNCGREVAVAATKSFTSEVVSLILITLWFSYYKEKRGLLKTQFKQTRIQYIDQLRQLPILAGQTLHQCITSVSECANYLAKKDHLFILGKGPCSAIAKEGALKIKEQTYKHAEAFSAGELKHGPLALVDPTNSKETPVLLIILNNEYFNDMNLALSEVHSRGALTIVITDCKQKLIAEQKVDLFIEIPSFGQELGWILPIIPMQMLALELCHILNLNPDKPRNLAKTVTTG